MYGYIYIYIIVIIIILLLLLLLFDHIYSKKNLHNSYHNCQITLSIIIMIVVIIS